MKYKISLILVVAIMVLLGCKKESQLTVDVDADNATLDYIAVNENIYNVSSPSSTFGTQNRYDNFVGPVLQKGDKIKIRAVVTKIQNNQNPYYRVTFALKKDGNSFERRVIELTQNVTEIDFEEEME